MSSLISWKKRLQNPPSYVSATYLDDLVFGNTFDGLEIAAKPEGTKNVIQSALSLLPEFEDVWQGCEEEYDALDLFLAALLKYVVHVDDEEGYSS